MAKRAALITLNPTLDLLFEGEAYSFSRKVFARHGEIAAGGSAINIARGLRDLGRCATVYTILGGEVGELVHDRMADERLDFRYAECRAETRVTAIVTDGGSSRMFVAPSPPIEPEVVEQLISRYYAEIAERDLILIGGSIPSEAVRCVISQLLCPLIRQGKKVIVDSRGQFAQEAHANKPFAARYNSDQNCSQAGRRRRNSSRQTAYDLHMSGIQLVLYTTTRCCYAIHDGRVRRYPHLAPETAHVFGRGDALLAGLIAALLDGSGFDDAIRLAAACRASFDREFPLGTINSLILGLPGRL